MEKKKINYLGIITGAAFAVGVIGMAWWLASYSVSLAGIVTSCS